jgi:F-type H+-transporting ATPase subunit b
MNISATIFVQAVWFALLIWFCMNYVWKPLSKAITERQSKISDGLSSAEKGRQALIDAERKGDAAMKEARDRASDMRMTAEKQASQMVEEAKTQARVEAEKIIASARGQIEQEVTKARNELRGQVAQLAVAGAEKILKREVDAKAHTSLLEELKAKI